MVRSLYSAVTGLKSQQNAMDVIGNNISNVNTVGFKASRVTFSELFYQTTKSATGPNEDTGAGGTNAKQIGLGASTSGISVDITNPGGFENTNRPFDLAINGDSFFVVQSKGSTYFTKAGNFSADEAGYLVTDSGAYVMGYVAEEPGKALQTDRVRPLEVYSEKFTYAAPEGTKSATLSGNLNKSDKNFGQGLYVTANLSVYDNLGNEYDVQVRFSRDYDTSTPPVPVTDASGNPIYNIAAAGVYSGSKLISDLNVNMAGTLTFDAVTGKILTGSPSAFELEITDAGTGTGKTDALGFTYTQDDVDQYLKENPTQTTAPFNVGDTRKIVVDCSSLTQFGTATDIEPAKGIDNSAGDKVGSLVIGTGTDKLQAWQISGGKKVGTMTSVGVSDKGELVAAYSNGANAIIGQIAVANFANPAGLEKMGDNMYGATINSGAFDGIGETVDVSGGSITSGVLEMSNVDLAQEFTKMIVTQRGFQANSRVVTTSDTMIEELLSLKR